MSKFELFNWHSEKKKHTFSSILNNLDKQTKAKTAKSVTEEKEQLNFQKKAQKCFEQQPLSRELRGYIDNRDFTKALNLLTALLKKDLTISDDGFGRISDHKSQRLILPILSNLNPNASTQEIESAINDALHVGWQQQISIKRTLNTGYGSSIELHGMECLSLLFHSRLNEFGVQEFEVQKTISYFLSPTEPILMNSKVFSSYTDLALAMALAIHEQNLERLFPASPIAQ